MADLTKRIIFIVLYWISEIKLISAYCEFNMCSVEEYCCSHNKCCPKVNLSLHIVAWTIAGLLGLLFLYFLIKFGKDLYQRFFRAAEDRTLLAKQVFA